ncbi:universal stress protein [Daejeonella sp.]|uniref:universal stress protein n=1 Tax=Daejeonella sp. TaxID=2805397 RepID=UPI0039836EDA
MKNILVTTDLSSNSKAALYFAIQLASQDKYNLTFFYSHQLMRPTSWSDKVFESFEKSETELMERKLERMVSAAYAKTGIKPGDYRCVILTSSFTEKTIMDYAEKNMFDFICISRRGCGIHKNIFGTTSSSLINNSAIPVIAVPPNYRPAKITRILYASDLSNLEKESGSVIEFARTLKAGLELLHFELPFDSYRNLDLIEKATKKFAGFKIQLQVSKFNFLESMSRNLDLAINKSKPSMVVMFTQQNRDFFERLFLPGATVSYAFKAKVPLLIFSKRLRGLKME